MNKTPMFPGIHLGYYGDIVEDIPLTEFFQYLQDHPAGL